LSRLSHIAEALCDLPKPTEKVQNHIRGAGIDLMGCILAGRDEEISVRTRQTVASFGSGSVPVFGTGLCLSPPHAALCNATAAHALDFDDWEEPGNTHPSAVLLPALWAVAMDRNKNGEAVLAAYNTGFELVARFGEAFNFEHYNKGWHSTATLGVIGVAAAVSHLIGLNAEQMANAMSLAISRSCGYTCQFGSSAKPLQAGFAASDGLMAALLAEQGMTGHPGVLDGSKGFVHLMAHGDLARLDAAVTQMNGKALEQWGIVLKAYPACGYTHRLVDCALEIAGTIEPDQIISVQAELPDFHYAILPYGKPTSRFESLFSVPFSIATSLLRGRFALEDLDEEARDAPEISALIEKIVVAPQPASRPSLNYDPDQPDRLVVHLQSGQQISAVCEYPKGAPQNPMSLNEIRQKFESIGGYREISPIDDLMDWPRAKSLSDLLRTFGEEL